MQMPTSTAEGFHRRARRLDAIWLHEFEDNPFEPDDNALFEMFDRKGWTDAQRRAYLTREARLRAEIAGGVE